MKRLVSFLALLSLAVAPPAFADQLLIVRSTQAFEEAMSALQHAIGAAGYQVARVQRVDIGLESRGYQTDKYRVVFYGKAEEVAALTEKYPEMIPYLPLNVAIFAEGNDTIVATSRPGVLAEFFPAPELKPVFTRWEKDLTAILDAVRAAR
jgi:uncharacterized protein (DUF302 family)